MKTENKIECLSISDLAECAREHEAKMDSIFTTDSKLNTLTINVAYPYEIDLDTIPNHKALVHWLYHLLGKVWMTAEITEEFIKRVCQIKGWNPHEKR